MRSATWKLLKHKMIAHNTTPDGGLAVYKLYTKKGEGTKYEFAPKDYRVHASY